MSLRTVALVGVIAAFAGSLLVFLPAPQNPMFWMVPPNEPAPFFVMLPGLALFFVGMVLLLYSWAAFLWRSSWLRANRAKSLGAYKLSYKAALAGALAFWAARTATHLVFPTLPLAATVEPLFSVGTMALSALVGFAVAFYLVRFYDRIPFKSPVVKSVLLSTLALVMFGGITTLDAEGGVFYYAVYLLYEGAAFTASGVVVGLVHSSIHGRQSPQLLEAGRPMQKRWWPYSLLIVGLVAAGTGVSSYEYSLQPVSFTASDVHFQITNGTLQVIANITNTSGPSLVQVDAGIDQFDDGVCGHGLNTNQTTVCRFTQVPPLPCSQLYPAYYHTLKLWAYFGNTRTFAESYRVTSVQLGCGGNPFA